jgi:lipopolysaccharide assembly protein A
MKFLSTLLTIAVVVATAGLGMLFALQNKVPVPLDILVYVFEPRSLALWLLLFFAVGGLAGMIFSSVLTLRQRAAHAGTRRKLARANSELDKLRTAGMSGGE